MDIKEFGEKNERVVVLVHPSMVEWDYFSYVIPLLEEDHRVFVPVLPGYDPTNDTDFTSVEEVAAEIADGLLARGVSEVHAVYGCSMGGSIVLRMAADGKISARHYIMDGGITPYQLPRPITRLIAVRDFLLVSLGKLGGEKLITKAFSSTSYTEEDYRYIAEVFKHCSYKTIWNSFESCNNYKMPKQPMHFEGQIHYWYADGEAKARDWDIKYMKKFVPDTIFKVVHGMDHGDMAAFHPERFASEIRALG